MLLNFCEVRCCIGIVADISKNIANIRLNLERYSNFGKDIILKILGPITQPHKKKSTFGPRGHTMFIIRFLGRWMRIRGLFMKNPELMGLNGPRIRIQRPKKRIINMVWPLGPKVDFCLCGCVIHPMGELLTNLLLDTPFYQ